MVSLNTQRRVTAQVHPNLGYRLYRWRTHVRLASARVHRMKRTCSYSSQPTRTRIINYSQLSDNTEKGATREVLKSIAYINSAL